MRSRRRIVFISIAALFLSSHVEAATPLAGKVSKPCTKAELVGVWEMVSVMPAVSKKDPVFYPHQRFVFNGDSSMKVMTSEKPFDAKVLAAFKSQPTEIDYSLDAKGILTMSWSRRPHTELAICAYVLQDVPPDMLKKIPTEKRAGIPKKGNVTLSFVGRNGKIVYQKVLKKIS